LFFSEAERDLLEVSDEFWLPEFFGVEVAEGGVKDR
jgi:hypothetical protein